MSNCLFFFFARFSSIIWKSAIPFKPLKCPSRFDVSLPVSVTWDQIVLFLHNYIELIKSINTLQNLIHITKANSFANLYGYLPIHQSKT